jgi:hypothetical protein
VDQLIQPKVTVTVQLPPELGRAALQAAWLEGVQCGVIAVLALWLAASWFRRSQ